MLAASALKEISTPEAFAAAKEWDKLHKPSTADSTPDTDQ